VLGALFLEEHRRISDAVDRSHVLVSLFGSTDPQVDLVEFVQFLDALNALFEDGLIDARLAGELRQRPGLAHIEAGSPVTIQILVALDASSGAAVAAGILLLYVVEALNQVFNGRTARKIAGEESRAGIKIDEAKAEAIDRESKARTEVLEARARAITRESEARVAPPPELPAEPETGVILIDRTDLAQVAGRRSRRLPARSKRAKNTLIQSPIEIDTVTLDYAKTRRRRARKRK
jgi:hypothetical protein